MLNNQEILRFRRISFYEADLRQSMHKTSVSKDGEELICKTENLKESSYRASWCKKIYVEVKRSGNVKVLVSKTRTTSQAGEVSLRWGLSTKVSPLRSWSSLSSGDENKRVRNVSFKDVYGVVGMRGSRTSRSRLYDRATRSLLFFCWSVEYSGKLTSNRKKRE